MPSRPLKIAIALIIAISVNATSQELSRPVASATVLNTLPTLDGDVVNDPAWKTLRLITYFTQWIPTNGESTTRKTEVYFGYSEEFLHVAVICHEDSHHDIVVSSDGFQSDSFTMVLDTFLTGQSGFVFGTNPIGAEYDGSITGNSTDWNWSTTWKVQAQKIEQGWSAECEIPFKSLRYANQEVQSWGVNFERFTVKNNEVSSWVPTPTQFSTYRLSRAGRMGNIRVPAPRRNLKITPFLRSGFAQTKLSGVSTEVKEYDAGFDLKYSLTHSLTLDATYNTDFAQVESDQLQINLGRFSLSFPETRPFFLENAGLFQVGSGDVQLFHSRTMSSAATTG